MAALGRPQPIGADRPAARLFGASPAARMDLAAVAQRRDARGRSRLARRPRGAGPGAPESGSGAGRPAAGKHAGARRPLEPIARRDQHLGQRRRARTRLAKGLRPLRRQQHQPQLALARRLWPAVRKARRGAAGGARDPGVKDRPPRPGDPHRDRARHGDGAAGRRHGADVRSSLPRRSASTRLCRTRSPPRQGCRSGSTTSCSSRSTAARAS